MASAVNQYDGYRTVDLVNVRNKLVGSLSPDPYSYIKHLQHTAPAHEQAAPGQKLPRNVRPSLIQRKLVAGQHTPAAALVTHPTPDATSGRNLRLDDQGLLAPEATGVHQFQLTLQRATHVGPSGMQKQRTPLRSVARMVLFDRQQNTFVGPAHSIPAAAVSTKDASWVWDGQGAPAQAPLGVKGSQGGASVGAALAGASGPLGGANTAIVRFDGVQGNAVGGSKAAALNKLMLYVELNVAFPLSADDAEVVPEAEHKAAQLVDELTLCWAMVSAERCAELSREMEISVPLYTGSVYDPQPLRQLYVAAEKKHPVRTFFNGPKQPMLTFCAGPLPHRPAPLLPYSLMPTNMIAHRDLASLLGAYRIHLAVQLALHISAKPPSSSHAATSSTAADPSKQAGRGLLPIGTHRPTLSEAVAAVAAASAAKQQLAPPADVAVGDPVLAAAGRLLKDDVLCWALVSRWQRWCKGALESPSCLSTCGDSSATPAAPSMDAVVAAFRRCVLEVAPLAHCASLPPASISNFAEYKAHRKKVVTEWFYEVPAGSSSSSKPVERDPVEPLSRSAKAYLHAPFDVRETRVCLGDTWQSSSNNSSGSSWFRS